MGRATSRDRLVAQLSVKEPSLLDRDGVLAFPSLWRDRPLRLGEAAVVQVDDGGPECWRGRRLVGDRRRASRTQMQIARLELVVLSGAEAGPSTAEGKVSAPASSQSASPAEGRGRTA